MATERKLYPTGTQTTVQHNPNQGFHKSQSQKHLQ